jgi:hypothetical protein
MSGNNRLAVGAGLSGPFMSISLFIWSVNFADETAPYYISFQSFKLDLDALTHRYWAVGKVKKGREEKEMR